MLYTGRSSLYANKINEQAGNRLECSLLHTHHCVFFDEARNCKNHVEYMCRVAYLHLHNMKIKDMIMHTYVTSRRNNGNSLLYGIGC